MSKKEIIVGAIALGVVWTVGHTVFWGWGGDDNKSASQSASQQRTAPPPMSSVNPYMGMAGGAMQAADNLMNCKTKAECDAAMAAAQHRNQQTQALGVVLGGLNAADSIGSSVNQGQRRRMFQEELSNDGMNATGYSGWANDSRSRGDTGHVPIPGPIGLLLSKSQGR